MIYKARMDLPEDLKSIIMEIQAVAAVAGITDQFLELEFDVDEVQDAYDLGYLVRNLEETLSGFYPTETIKISKPKLKE